MVCVSALFEFGARVEVVLPRLQLRSSVCTVVIIRAVDKFRFDAREAGLRARLEEHPLGVRISTLLNSTYAAC